MLLYLIIAAWKVFHRWVTNNPPLASGRTVTPRYCLMRRLARYVHTLKGMKTLQCIAGHKPERTQRVAALIAAFTSETPPLLSAVEGTPSEVAEDYEAAAVAVFGTSYCDRCRKDVAAVFYPRHRFACGSVMK